MRETKSSQEDDVTRGPKLFTSPEQKAELEARNGLRQFDEVLKLIDESQTQPFLLRPSTIQLLHRLAIQDIYTCAGNYRTSSVIIQNSKHHPPPSEEVSRLVEDMCDYVEENWDRSAMHLAAYIMWRVNWIHPFAGGNGRTARAVSHLVLCAKLRYRLPGTTTIPEQIVSDRKPYYKALDAGDEAWEQGEVDVGEMETLLSDMLAQQLVSVHEEATGRNIA